jgi:hypothetical protein
MVRSSRKFEVQLTPERLSKIVAFLLLTLDGLRRRSVAEFQKPPRDVFRYVLEQSEKGSFHALPGKGLRIRELARITLNVSASPPE